MAAPQQIDLRADKPADFSLAEGSPHVVVYDLWMQLGGVGDWHLFGSGRTNDNVSDHFIVMPPIPNGTKFGYSLAVGGAANTNWRVVFSVQHPQIPNSLVTWEETGVTSDDGNGLGHETRFAQLDIV